MKKRFAALVSCCAMAHGAVEMDLASDSAWTLRCDDGPARPLVMEVHKQGSGRVDGLQGSAHAFIMEHYSGIGKVGEGHGIRGMGEMDWGTDKLGDFANHARTMRLNDWAYFAPWSMVNFWPNLLEGMNHDRHPWKFNNHADRTDGVDGWGSPLVKSLQFSTHPYFVMDREWPATPAVVAGQPVTRTVEVFNGGLTGNQLTLRWTAHWDSPSGPAALSGGEIPCIIEPGFHATQTIAFTVPKITQDTRKLYLVLESSMAGKIVFRSEETCLTSSRRQVKPSDPAGD